MSAPTVRVCRACDEPIEDEADGVIVLHDTGNSGPGWTVWAHAGACADDVELIDPDLLRIMTRIWAAKIQQ